MTYRCSRCGRENEIVNQCGCDPNNMPTRVSPRDEFTRRLVDFTATHSVSVGFASAVAEWVSGNWPGIGLDHADLCRLSQAFNESASLWTEQDRRINEWLKGRLTDARTEGQP